MADLTPNHRPRVLVFDEDPEMGDLIGVLIRDEGCEAVVCSHLETIETFLAQSRFDLLISDARISQGSLDSFLKSTSEPSTGSPSSPGFLFLSDRDFAVPARFLSERVRVLVRPFDRVSLMGAVRALTGFHSEAPGLLRVGPFCLDLRSQDVECEGLPVRLTASEFRLLQELLRNAGQVLSRDHLMTHVQGEGVAVVDRAIDTHVVSLRKKLGPHGTWIETVRGSGYVFRKIAE
jgi:DNA-binding response OmpR family regulator